MKRAMASPTAERSALLPMISLSLACATALASEIGQQAAGRVDLATYRYYLDGRLFTHDCHDRGTYPPGREHDLARDSVVEAFQSFGLSIELQYIGGPFYNVIATQVGTTYPDSYYVIGAHYDSVAWIDGYQEGNPGADDDASGVAGMLEIARVLSLYETEYTVKYIAFDIEEWGMNGSQAYVQDHLTDDIRGMVSLDMIAWNSGGYSCEIRGRTQSDAVKLALAEAVDLYGNDLIATVGGEADGSDHAPFEWAGFPACLLIEGDHWDNPCYHQHCDSVDTPDYIAYGFAIDMVRSAAGFLADQAGAQPPFDCDTGTGCEPGGLGGEDCDGDGVGDLCEIFCGAALDCNGNHVPDECDLVAGLSDDCDQNGVPDECDAASGGSVDENHNLIPDECEPDHTLYVDDDAPGDPGPGDPDSSDPLEDGSAARPYDAIQEAIWASKSGDLVLVRPGVYHGQGNRELDFGGRLITVQGETGPQTCIIHCEGRGRGFYFHKGEGSAAAVAGLAITSGYPDWHDEQGGGGGICCVGASPTITQCVIAGNTGEPYGGGGILCLNGANPTIADCVITGNGAQLGSGIFALRANPTITGCMIVGNVENGVVCWLSNAMVADCLIAGNGSDGISCDGGSPIFANCTVVDNANWGIVDYASRSIITNCIVWDSVDLHGNAAVTFCDIAGGWPGTGNIAADPSFVGGPTGTWTADPTYDPPDFWATYLVTFTDGDAAWAPGSLVGKLIIPDTAWPTACGVVAANSTTTITVWFTDWYVWAWITAGTEYQIRDYHLLPDSPVIEAGDPSYAPRPAETDLDGQVRVWDGDADGARVIDMGSDEFGGPALGDLNCDGALDLGDINPFVLFLSNFASWQATFPGCDPIRGDINGDGTYGQWAFDDINPFRFLLTGK